MTSLAKSGIMVVLVWRQKWRFAYKMWLLINGCYICFLNINWLKINFKIVIIFLRTRDAGHYSNFDDLFYIYNKEIKNNNHLFGVSMLGKTSSVTSRLKASVCLISCKIFMNRNFRENDIILLLSLKHF